MRLSLMIEGQEGVSWPEWVALAESCEDSGLEGLFRSDHYSGFHGLADGALDAWATLSALAAVTSRIRLGSLVSPVTFRHPSVLARLAVTADHVSGGRVELGIGGAWNELEHQRAGFPFPPLHERLELLAEQVEVVRRSWDDEPFDFTGKHYTLRGASPMPKPLGRLNLIVGGTARSGTVTPAVRFADEYNTTSVSPAGAAERREGLLRACERAGREPLAFSVMTQCVVGTDARDLDRRLDRLTGLAGRDPRERREVSIIGTVDEVVERIAAYERAGVERLMLQHLLHDDLEMVELLGREIAPHVG